MIEAIALASALACNPAKMAQARAYPAALVRIVDGDTMDWDLDLGMGIRQLTRVRLWGIDTPEVRGPEKIEGVKVSQWASDWLQEHQPHVILVGKNSKYGQPLAIIMGAGKSLNQALVKEGSAKVYCGGRKGS